MMSVLDRANGAHRNKNNNFYALDFFTNNSKSMVNLRFKFDPLDVFDPMEMINSLDCEL